jgi:membrane protease YdiL (CAAX protease family)
VTEGAAEIRDGETPIWAHILPFVAFFFVAHLLGDDTPRAIAAGAAAAVGALAWLKPWRDAPTWAHVAPFALWLALMSGLGDPTGGKYAIRTVAGAALLIAVRPWRWYGPLRLRNVPLALAVGLAIFIVWVGLESDAVRAAAPGLAVFYEKFLVGPLPGGFGNLREPLAAYPYLPSVTGWPLFAVHMFGTSVVIAIVEEFFWRGFLYRWLCGRNFLDVAVTRMDTPMWLATAALFGVEHAEWFAGIVCGLAFAWIVLRTGDIWAAILAHGVTNFLLGLYVLRTDSWWFW